MAVQRGCAIIVSADDYQEDLIMGTHSSGRPATSMQVADHERFIHDCDLMWLQRGQRLGEMLMAVVSSPETREEPAVSTGLADLAP
jgi:hypothetical protein